MSITLIRISGSKPGGVDTQTLGIIRAAPSPDRTQTPIKTFAPVPKRKRQNRDRDPWLLERERELMPKDNPV